MDNHKIKNNTDQIVIKVDSVRKAFAARSVLKKHNLPVYGHGTGHGFGLEVHESPLLIQNNKTKLVSGNVTTIEPAVYIPGKLGIRIEDDILVTETGCQILTRISHKSSGFGRSFYPPSVFSALNVLDV